MATRKKPNLQINVTGNNVERALKKLKKASEREGIKRDWNRRDYFEPRTQRRRKRLMRAIKQNYLRMAAQGLL